MPYSVVGGMQGHAPCKILSLQQILFLCQLIFVKIIRLLQCSGESVHPQLLEILSHLNQWLMFFLLLTKIKLYILYLVYQISSTRSY